MSDTPQSTGPDLHALFGIDGEHATTPSPSISLDRAGGGVGMGADRRRAAWLPTRRSTRVRAGPTRAAQLR